MTNTTIRLTSIEDVKKFVSITNRYSFKINLISDKYTIDAKSIMGIFSLDLSKPIDLNIHADGDVDAILAALDPYIIK